MQFNISALRDIRMMHDLGDDDRGWPRSAVRRSRSAAELRREAFRAVARQMPAKTDVAFSRGKFKAMAVAGQVPVNVTREDVAAVTIGVESNARSELGFIHDEVSQRRHHRAGGKLIPVGIVALI